jgi:putative peptidoglycan lipid II flippase
MKKSGAIFVAIGIFMSRVAGLVRERVFAHYFGNSDAGDAFKAALKIPNFLQNLFGEGVLSASFIPVYAKLISQNNEEEAQKVAGTIFTLLMLVVSALVLAGVLCTPWMIDVIAPGFHGEKRDLTIHLVQIFFPGLGFLVLSAWCLGVLNSHRKFFLSYFAPVIWNITIIGFLVYFGPHSGQSDLAVKVAWGLVAGSFLQFLIQFPMVMGLLKKLRISLQTKTENIRVVIKNFFPVVLSRGVVQVSAYIDNLLASFLPTGAVSSLAYSQTLYLLPVSLFGMSVSAAELPTMSQAQGSDEEVFRFLRERLMRGLRQIAFFIIPSVVGFVVLGDVIVSAIFQTGEFNHDNAIYVWKVLAGATIGLLATTQGRLYSSAFYSLKDTRTPLKFAVVRVILTTILGYLFALPIPRYFHLDPSLGTVGLTASAGMSGWVEFLLLKRALNKRVGNTYLSVKYQIQLWFPALLGAMTGFFIKWNFLKNTGAIFTAVIVLFVYGVIYLLGTLAIGVPESRQFLSRFRSPKNM